MARIGADRYSRNSSLANPPALEIQWTDDTSWNVARMPCKSRDAEERNERTPTMFCEPPSFRDSLRDAALKFAEGRRKNASQRVGAPAGEGKAEGDQELRKSVLHTIVRKVKAVGKMDQEDRTGHHDHDAESTNADKGAREQSESSRKLRKTYQEADDYRGVHEACKAMNAGAPKGAKENGAAVVEKDECASEAEDEQGEIEFAGSGRRRPG